MKLVFYSPILNNHQVHVADALWELTKHQYCFVELSHLQQEHMKGDTHDYADRPYLLRAWNSPQSYQQAMILAQNAECCVFSGIQALPFQIKRLKLRLLSFDMSERWLKRGILNLVSPVIFKMFLTYHFYRWSKFPLYKLCCSAFAVSDHLKLRMYRNKCFQWGYFTQVNQPKIFKSPEQELENQTTFMWCSRFLKWKHPELPILMAAYLKQRGYRFVLDMYGQGECENYAHKLVRQLGLDNVVNFHGSKNNEEIIEAMRQHRIFLLTSDQNEGWGVVANEAMANGCVLVASEAVGSVPYLIKEGISGLTFTSSRPSRSFNNPDRKALESLCNQVEWLLKHPVEMEHIRKQSLLRMYDLFSPRVAAVRLLKLIEGLQNGWLPDFPEGPCSPA